MYSIYICAYIYICYTYIYIWFRFRFPEENSLSHFQICTHFTQIENPCYFVNISNIMEGSFQVAGYLQVKKYSIINIDYMKCIKDKIIPKYVC